MREILLLIRKRLWLNPLEVLKGSTSSLWSCFCLFLVGQVVIQFCRAEAKEPELLDLLAKEQLHKNWLLPNVSQAILSIYRVLMLARAFPPGSTASVRTNNVAKWAAFSLFINCERVLLGGLPREIPQWDCLTTEFFGHDTCLVIMSWNILNPCSYTDDSERNLTHAVSPVFALLCSIPKDYFP